MLSSSLDLQENEIDKGTKKRIVDCRPKPANLEVGCQTEHSRASSICSETDEIAEHVIFFSCKSFETYHDNHQTFANFYLKEPMDSL